MASYAEVAAANADQSPEEAAAPPPPQIIPTTTTNPLPDVDTSINVVPADYLSQDIKTATQAERIVIEQENAANQAALNARAAAEHDKEEAKAAKETAKDKAEKKTEEVREKVRRKMEKGRERVRREVEEEPEVVINAIGVGLVAVGLGVFGYKRWWKAGNVNWKEAGFIGLGLAVLGGVDYWFTKQFLVKKRQEAGRK